MMLRRLSLSAVITLCLILAACGESNDAASPTEADRSIPGGADEQDVAVIDEWATALASGDVEKAAGYFRIPSIAENGGVLLRIESRGQARLFNSSLPCGAELVRAESQGEFTTATFRLTERPGPGTCGAGSDGEAQTAFVIEDGQIVEWRRVGSGTQSAPSRPA